MCGSQASYNLCHSNRCGRWYIRSCCTAQITLLLLFCLLLLLSIMFRWKTPQVEHANSVAQGHHHTCTTAAAIVCTLLLCNSVIYCFCSALSEWPKSLLGEMTSLTRCFKTFASGKPPSVLRFQTVTPSARTSNVPATALGCSATSPI
jgi:hypothetical protein